MKYYFVFNGTDSRDLGIYIESMPQTQRPRKRVTTVTIPGRAGALTISEGDEAYDTYIQSMVINVRPERAQELIDLLNGEGWLTLCNDPHVKQRAQVLNAFTLKRISKGLEWLNTTLAFTCQPYKYSIAETVEVYDSGDFINNDGDVVERPVITVYGTGTISVKITGMGESSESFVVEDVNGGCVIDCDAREVLTLEGELITSHSKGEFPAIPARKRQYIFLTGAESCSIKRAVRRL